MSIWSRCQESNLNLLFRRESFYPVELHRESLVPRLGFEPRTLFLLREATLPDLSSRALFGGNSWGRTLRIQILSLARIPIPSQPHKWCKVQESNLVLRIFSPPLNHQTSSPCNIFSYCSFSTITIFLSLCVSRTMFIFSLSLPHQCPLTSNKTS